MVGPIPWDTAPSFPLSSRVRILPVWKLRLQGPKGEGEHLRIISPSILHTRTVIAWPYSSAIWELTSSKVTYKKTKGGGGNLGSLYYPKQQPKKTSCYCPKSNTMFYEGQETDFLLIC